MDRIDIAPIQDIIDNDLCIACGACVYVCPEQIVLPSYSEIRGAYEVRIVEAEACNTCTTKPCGDVCPSVSAITADNSPLDRVGKIESVHIGHSIEFQHNGVSSSGGIVREICYDFIRKGVSVICLTESISGGKSTYEAGMLDDLKMLETMPGSIYHSVSFINAISILKEESGPFALVSIPCHLEGIVKYIQKYEPKLEEKIIFRLGIICGWMFSDHGLKNFVQSHNLESPILDAKYRGEDKVGLLKIKTSESVHKFDRRKFDTLNEMIAFRSSFSTDVNRLRCRLCQNHTNIQSDISIGDAWLSRKGKQKLSILVVRTSRGKKILDSLVNQSRIELEIGSEDDILESQGEDLVYGHTAQKLAKIMTAADKPAPNYPFSENSSAVMYKDRFKFGLERMKRELLQRGSYRTYRVLYTILKLKSVIGFILKRN